MLAILIRFVLPLGETNNYATRKGKGAIFLRRAHEQKWYVRHLQWLPSHHSTRKNLEIGRSRTGEDQLGSVRTENTKMSKTFNVSQNH